VRKRPFTVRRADGDVPAIIWLPERTARRRPLVLLGHGGGMHKESPPRIAVAVLGLFGISTGPLRPPGAFDRRGAMG
jgi:hypothetical protein